MVQILKRWEIISVVLNIIILILWNIFTPDFISSLGDHYHLRSHFCSFKYYNFDFVKKCYSWFYIFFGRPLSFLLFHYFQSLLLLIIFFGGWEDWTVSFLLGNCFSKLLRLYPLIFAQPARSCKYFGLQNLKAELAS